jgi:2-oxoglutarate dehydrogenase E2 component (dihydrolipoamide succinyltransferase)
VPMSRMRMKVAENLKSSQDTYALLTTFNEIDMSGYMNLRKEYGEAFLKKHDIKLGFMSGFLKASTIALRDQPIVNAVIEGKDIVYRDFVDISVAVSTPKGLVVPVLRNCQDMQMYDFERELVNLGNKAKDGKITLEDMTGGSFTISNGGVFGSMMGTPIVNPPQSAILGMHATKLRPVVVGGKIEARPIMYVALTYDHRIIDGREAVTFLK